MDINLSVVNILGQIIFSGVGFVGLMYGRKMGRFKMMFLGGVLMTYSYFITNTPAMYLVGAVLSIALYRERE